MAEALTDYLGTCELICITWKSLLDQDVRPCPCPWYSPMPYAIVSMEEGGSKAPDINVEPSESAMGLIQWNTDEGRCPL